MQLSLTFLALLTSAAAFAGPAELEIRNEMNRPKDSVIHVVRNDSQAGEPARVGFIYCEKDRDCLRIGRPTVQSLT